MHAADSTSSGCQLISVKSRCTCHIAVSCAAADGFAMACTEAKDQGTSKYAHCPICHMALTCLATGNTAGCHFVDTCMIQQVQLDGEEFGYIQPDVGAKTKQELEW